MSLSLLSIENLYRREKLHNILLIMESQHGFKATSATSSPINVPSTTDISQRNYTNFSGRGAWANTTGYLK